MMKSASLWASVVVESEDGTCPGRRTSIDACSSHRGGAGSGDCSGGSLSKGETHDTGTMWSCSRSHSSGFVEFYAGDSRVVGIRKRASPQHGRHCTCSRGLAWALVLGRLRRTIAREGHQVQAVCLRGHDRPRERIWLGLHHYVEDVRRAAADLAALPVLVGGSRDADARLPRGLMLLSVALPRELRTWAGAGTQRAGRSALPSREMPRSNKRRDWLTARPATKQPRGKRSRPTTPRSSWIRQRRGSVRPPGSSTNQDRDRAVRHNPQGLAPK